jgi:hypothetical protein
VAWDSFENAGKLIEAGEAAAQAAVPRIKSWLDQAQDVSRLAPVRPQWDSP